jgi:hypothetical protein
LTLTGIMPKLLSQITSVQLKVLEYQLVRNVNVWISCIFFHK